MYRIEYRGESDDAYVVGDLTEALAAAERSEGVPLDVRTTAQGGGYLAEDADGNYWGAGPTEDDALRFLVGAVLDPREGR